MVTPEVAGAASQNAKYKALMTASARAAMARSLTTYLKELKMQWETAKTSTSEKAAVATTDIDT